MTPEEEKVLQKYMDAIDARSATGQIDSPDVAGDEYATPVNTMAEDQAKLQALSDQTNAAGGKLQTVGGATTAAGAVGGNPVVAGVGLGLQTIGAIDDAKRKAEQAKIDAYNKKIMAQRSAIRNMFE